MAMTWEEATKVAESITRLATENGKLKEHNKQLGDAYVEAMDRVHELRKENETLNTTLKDLKDLFIDDATVKHPDKELKDRVETERVDLFNENIRLRSKVKDYEGERISKALWEMGL